MWARGITILLLLGYSGASSQPQDGGGFLSKISGTAKNAVDSVFRRVDITHVYKDVTNTIKSKIGSSSCIAGLYLDINHSDKTLKLIQGKMSDLNHIKVSGRTLGTTGDVSTATITYTFNKIPIRYRFFFTTHRGFIKMDRDGHVDLLENGAVSVEFTVELPKTQTGVDELVKQNKCVGSIKGVKTYIKSKLVTNKIDYHTLGTMIGLRLTEKSVRNILTGLKQDLEDNITAAAKLMIEPVFRSHPFNCKDAAYTEPVGASAKRATDCDYFNTAKKYKPANRKDHRG